MIKAERHIVDAGLEEAPTSPSLILAASTNPPTRIARSVRVQNFWPSRATSVIRPSG